MKTSSKFICALLLFTLDPVSKSNSKEAWAEQIIEQRLSEKLPRSFRGQAHGLSKHIVSESVRYRLDPYLVTAVIAGESSYNPLARGSQGEIGLMQLKPATAKWIAAKRRLVLPKKWKLEHPLVNITLGTAYLSHLKERFSPTGGELFLSAFNMGPTKLLRKLSLNVQPNIYRQHVMKNYVAGN